MFGKLFSKKTSKQTSEHASEQASIQSHESLTTADTEQLIVETLTNYVSSNFPQGIMDICQQFSIDHVTNKSSLVVKLTMPFPCQSELDDIANNLTEVVNKPIIFDIQLKVAAVRQSNLTGTSGNIANVIAIASGKGGVGKSTTTVNLAYALISEGARVGILDADIYGPSIPTMLGIADEKPSSSDGKLMTPLEVNGLSAMSIGFLVDASDATVWRGPMASGAFNQLLNETAWPELDYLLIDMPPGTGDIQLTLAQKVPVAAAVIVTTPQDIALIDAAKGVAMFDKVQVPVLGIVENMSYHLCENCGHKSHIFGEAGGKEMAKIQKTQLLGQLPLDLTIRQDADRGQSELIDNSTGAIAMHYRKIARNMAAQLFLQCDNASSLTPTVEITD